MYVKLFSQILDSSIWMESGDTRLVWITLLAAMDQDGFARFASVANLAHRARVPDAACDTAVQVLEAPDPHSSDPSFEGRRIERVPGGWLVLNYAKYRELASEANRREKTRERVKRWKQAQRDGGVTDSDAGVRKGNARLRTGNGGVPKGNDMEKQKQKQKQKQERKKADRRKRRVRPPPSLVTTSKT